MEFICSIFRAGGFSANLRATVPFVEDGELKDLAWYDTFSRCTSYEIIRV
ncbi:hypothetical protein HanXRQr2_Chr15g0702581 [Helianthus annuus]|uniref:Uncharacterized protein n=1 Tax=Helianthus annuus TaxID=4232 RepID=A0A9K3E300_HELAN|nr:hypothetical protein HanXRQr2_Chr15g0702581 [Helianthus annuus]KAJ0832032.1 hypothetical protein HanPSC8_Chr15g0674091 [Helianthus annuus]